MKLTFAIAVAAIFSIPATIHAEPRIRNLAFYSPSVHDTMKVVVLLPSRYDASLSYPVLYLLHGYGGNQNDWTRRTGLVRYTSGLRMIVVMPEARNSWYVNSRTDPDARFENYIMDDLPRFINSHFPIDTSREAIAGLSMGGYGAMMLALRYPRRFLFAGDLSGAITIPQIIDSVQNNPHFKVDRSQKPVMPNIIRTFGRNDRRFREEHNVFCLLAHNASSSIPYIFMAAGIQDQHTAFLPTDHHFIDSLRARGVMYEYHEIPGQHDWKFWDKELNPMLRRMAEVMKIKDGPADR